MRWLPAAHPLMALNDRLSFRATAASDPLQTVSRLSTWRSFARLLHCLVDAQYDQVRNLHAEPKRWVRVIAPVSATLNSGGDHMSTHFPSDRPVAEPRQQSLGRRIRRFAETVGIALLDFAA